MVSFYKIYCRFNLISLTTNFSMFILFLIMKDDFKSFDNLLYSSIAFQSFLIIFCIFHYLQVFHFHPISQSNLGIMNQIFDFIPLAELLIVINFELRYYYLTANDSWVFHLKILYFIIKSIMNSIKRNASLKFIYSFNIISLGFLISNILLIYGIENIEMGISLIGQIFSCLFSLIVLVFFLKANFCKIMVIDCFINEMCDPFVIIQEINKKNNLKKYEISFYNIKAMQLLTSRNKNSFSFENLKEFYQGFALNIPHSNNELKNKTKIFQSLTDIFEYYNKKSETKEKIKMKFIKPSLIKPKISSEFDIDLALSIQKTIIQNKVYFFLKMKEKKSKEQKKSDFQKRLLTSISHELKTPLNASLSLLEIVKNEFEEESHNYNLITNSTASLRLLENTLNNIIDQSLFMADEFILCLSYVNIKELIDQIYSIIKSQIELKSLNYSIEIDDFLSFQPIYTDNIRLKQVILNIILNSIQFTHNGSIKLEVKIISKFPLEIEFIIEDTGIGMKNDFCKELIKKMNNEKTDFQANSTGSCMGLTISNKIAFLLGDRKIDVNSDFGKGTKINFRVKDLKNENKKACERKSKEVLTYSNNQRIINYDSIRFSSQLIESRRKKNKNQNDPWNLNSETDNDTASIYVKTNNFKLSHQRKHNFDSIKKQVMWNDYLTSQKTILSSSFNKTIFSKKKSTVSHSNTMKNSDKHGSLISDIPILEEKDETNKNQNLNLDLEINSFSNRYINYKSKKSNFLIPSPIHRVADGFENKCICEQILIVDDDAFNLLSLEMIIRLFGFRVVKAMDGQEAITKVKNQKCNEIKCEGFKLIFMDYQMPVMDGVASTREILKIKNIPIIGCTAFTTKEHITKCLDAGMKDVIFKPISKENICKILEEWIN